MEKLFIYILDIVKYLEVKAQEKSQRKKYWILGNQYIQEVDDMDGEKCLDQNFAKKAKCVYQAAKTGMKEGMLAGIFLGGFYGLIKNLNENMSITLMSPCVSTVNSSGDGTDQGVTEKSETANETDNQFTIQSDTNNPQPESDFREETFVRESATAQFKKRGKSTYIKSEPRDRGGEAKMEKRPISARQSANESSSPVENVRPNTVTNVVSNKSKMRGREKVEIVGYAFVQTLGSKGSDISTSTSSDDADRRKRESRKLEDESDSQNRCEPKSSVSSDQSGRLSASTYSKNVLASIEEVRRRKELYQKNGDRRQIVETKSSSSLILSSASSQDSYRAQVLQEIKSKANFEPVIVENRFFETQAYVTKVTSDRKNLESERQKYGQSTTVLSRQKSVVVDKGKMGVNKGNKKNTLKGIRLPSEVSEVKDSKSESKRGDKSSKSKKGLCKIKKGYGLNKQKKGESSKRMVFDAYCDNIFIPHKISKSILVDADLISNSLSLNNDSSDEKINPQAEVKLKTVDSPTQKMCLVMEPPKTTIKDDDSISYSEKKRLTFVEPEPEISEKPPARSESTSPSLTRIQEDSANSDNVDSINSDSESGSASHLGTSENLNEPVQGIQSPKTIHEECPIESVSVHSVQSPARISGDNLLGSGQSVEPSDKPTVVGSAPVLTGYTSPKTVSIGDTTPSSFVEPFSSVQSKELAQDESNDGKSAGNELAVARVNVAKDSQISGAFMSKCHILKNFSDSLIIISACNCALVLGVLCAVVSSTKASLSF